MLFAPDLLPFILEVQLESSWHGTPCNAAGCVKAYCNALASFAPDVQIGLCRGEQEGNFTAML